MNHRIWLFVVAVVVEQPPSAIPHLGPTAAANDAVLRMSAEARTFTREIWGHRHNIPHLDTLERGCYLGQRTINDTKQISLCLHQFALMSPCVHQIAFMAVHDMLVPGQRLLHVCEIFEGIMMRFYPRPRLPGQTLVNCSFLTRLLHFPQKLDHFSSMSEL